MIKIYYFIFFLVLMSTELKAQILIDIEDNDFKAVEALVKNYVHYYDMAAQSIKIPAPAYISLFENVETEIPADFPCAEVAGESMLSLPDYIYAFNHCLAKGGVTFGIIKQKSILYCIQGNVWYVWVTKEVSSKVSGTLASFHNVQRLTISRAKSGVYRIRHIQSVKRVPKDIDHDQIADRDEDGKVCDDCLADKFSTTAENLITTRGCLEYDWDGDGVNNASDCCPHTYGIPSNCGCPNPPSSRLGVSLFIGTQARLSGDFDNDDVVVGSNWARNAQFIRPGYFVDMSLLYNCSRLFGVSTGVTFINNPFDQSHLINQINYFLGNNGLITDNVSASSTAYKFLLPYASVRFGNFAAINNNFSVEPFVGYSLTDIGFFKNEVSLTVNYPYQSGRAVESYHISYKSSPSFTYGLKLGYERRLDVNNRGRISAKISYRHGDYGFTSQNFNFAGISGPARFGGGPFSILTFAVGMYLSFKTPKEYKEKYY